jgi:hypothetical protein
MMRGSTRGDWQSSSCRKANLGTCHCSRNAATTLPRGDRWTETVLNGRGDATRILVLSPRRPHPAEAAWSSEGLCVGAEGSVDRSARLGKLASPWRAIHLSTSEPLETMPQTQRYHKRDTERQENWSDASIRVRPPGSALPGLLFRAAALTTAPCPAAGTVPSPSETQGALTRAVRSAPMLVGMSCRGRP